MKLVDRQREEYAQFQRLLAWCTSVVTRMLHEEGSVAPHLFFVRLGERTIARVGVVKLLGDDSGTGRHLQIMNQVVGLDNVDVAVFVRDWREVAKGEDDGDATDIVMFHMTGKHYEATVVCRRQTGRTSLECMELEVSHLHARNGSRMEH
ncbi:MAG: hypothetical protein IPI02_12045 [Sterolibacteriaceae bacterium]|nr:hypothetical protein [Sterolibacteriaceae bacterium]